MEEQALNPAEWLSILRRFRRLIVVLMLVGVGGGIVYTVAEPALYSAKALVLLPSPGLGTAGQGARDAATDAQIARSPGILDRAGAEVRPRLDFLVLQKRITVAELTPEILQITARGTTSRQAQQLANDVATGFVAYTAKAAALLPSVTLNLEKDAYQIQRQITDLQQEITTTTATAADFPPGSSQAEDQIVLLNTLGAEQQDARLQLDSVNGQIAQAQLNEANDASGTVVLERATTATVPSLLRPLINVLLGLLAGLLVGTLVAVVVGRRDRRLHRRDDIVAVVGAPVVASVSLSPRQEVRDWIDLFVRWEPGVEEGWTVRRMLSRLTDGPTVTDVTVIALAGDQAALVLAPQLAASASVLGIPVAFVDGTGHKSALSLRLASDALATAPSPARRPSLRVCNVDDTPNLPPGGLMVTAVVLNPHDPEWPATAEPPPARPRTTWLALSSGFATNEDLARVAVAASDLGLPIAGVVVVNADPHDSTTGAYGPRIGDLGPVPARVVRSAKDAVR